MQDVENRFMDSRNDQIYLDDIMFELKEKYQNQTIKLKELNRKTYHLIVRKAVSLGVSVDDVFNMYGLKCNGININRLSKVFVDEIPYLQEMKARRNELMKETGISLENGFCKEEVFEAKLRVCKQVYNEFKEKIYNFVPEKAKENEEATI